MRRSFERQAIHRPMQRKILTCQQQQATNNKETTRCNLCPSPSLFPSLLLFLLSPLSCLLRFSLLCVLSSLLNIEHALRLDSSLPPLPLSTFSLLLDAFISRTGPLCQTPDELQQRATESNIVALQPNNIKLIAARIKNIYFKARDLFLRPLLTRSSDQAPLSRIDRETIALLASYLQRHLAWQSQFGHPSRHPLCSYLDLAQHYPNECGVQQFFLSARGLPMPLALLASDAKYSFHSPPSASAEAESKGSEGEGEANEASAHARDASPMLSLRQMSIDAATQWERVLKQIQRRYDQQAQAEAKAAEEEGKKKSSAAGAGIDSQKDDGEAAIRAQPAAAPVASKPTRSRPPPTAAAPAADSSVTPDGERAHSVTQPAAVASLLQDMRQRAGAERQAALRAALSPSKEPSRARATKSHCGAKAKKDRSVAASGNAAAAGAESRKAAKRSTAEVLDSMKQHIVAGSSAKAASASSPRGNASSASRPRAAKPASAAKPAAAAVSYPSSSSRTASATPAAPTPAAAPIRSNNVFELMRRVRESAKSGEAAQGGQAQRSLFSAKRRANSSKAK